MDHKRTHLEVYLLVLFGGGGSSNDGPSGDKTFYIMVSATTMNEHISKK